MKDEKYSRREHEWANLIMPSPWSCFACSCWGEVGEKYAEHNHKDAGMNQATAIQHADLHVTITKYPKAET